VHVRLDQDSSWSGGRGFDSVGAVLSPPAYAASAYVLEVDYVRAKLGCMLVWVKVVVGMGGAIVGRSLPHYFCKLW